MSPAPRIAAVLFYLSSLAWVYHYLYPIWQGCGFPLVQLEAEPPRPPLQFPFFQHDATREAPFRLLVLADPQLEGDTSLPELEWKLSTLLPWNLVYTIFQSFQYVRKKVDLWGNDRYLAHIYSSLKLFTNPTHATVLGDLLGSQWITDDEFEHRADRFWNVVFAGSEMVPEYITRQPLKEVLGEDEAWRNRLINIAGNHDIGYAGDMTEERMERFERRFGRSNWEIEFELPPKKKVTSFEGFEFVEEVQTPTTDEEGQGRQPSIRIFVLNSMNLDTPALTPRLQNETYAAVNSFISRSRSVEDSKDVLTIILTHVPLFKHPGVCADGPYFTFYTPQEGGGLKEQNHLSDYASRIILESIYGMSDQSPGRNGVILDGHDHEGCDVWHFLPSQEAASYQPSEEKYANHRWNTTNWYYRKRVPEAVTSPGIREMTLRAMMGEFGGNAAFLSAWFDEEAGKWGYEISKCAAGSQHIWWAIHVLFLVTAGVGAVGVYEWQASSIQKRSAKRAEDRAKVKAAKSASIRKR